MGNWGSMMGILEESVDFIREGKEKRNSGDFSTETVQARRNWHKIFKVMKSKNLQPILFDPAKLSFRIEGQIKTFPDKSSSPLSYYYRKC